MPDLVRLPNLVASLPHSVLIELAVSGCRADNATRALADKAIGTLLPSCASRVFSSPDLLSAITALMGVDGMQSAATCRAWAQVWRNELKKRQLPLQFTRLLEGPLPRVHPGLNTIPVRSLDCAVELPNRDVVVIDPVSLHEVDVGYNAYLCSPSFAVRERVLRYHGDVQLSPAYMECDGDSLFVLDCIAGRVFSFDATTLAAQTASKTFGGEDDKGICIEFLAMGLDCLFFTFMSTGSTDDDGIVRYTKEIVKLAKGSLEQIITFGADCDIQDVNDMAVLGDVLYISQEFPGDWVCAQVLMFSMGGELLRQADLDFWCFSSLRACHGRLYAIEFVEYDTTRPDRRTDQFHAEVRQVLHEAGRRLLVLSPQLELLQAYRLPESKVISVEPQEGPDFSFVAPLTGSDGGNLLLVAENHRERMHIFAAPA